MASTKSKPSDCCVDCERKFTEKITAAICTHCKMYRCANCRLKHYCTNKIDGLFGMADPPQKRKSRKGYEDPALLLSKKESQSTYDASTTLVEDGAPILEVTVTALPAESSNEKLQEIGAAAVLLDASGEETAAAVVDIVPLQSNEILTPKFIDRTLSLPAESSNEKLQEIGAAAVFLETSEEETAAAVVESVPIQSNEILTPKSIDITLTSPSIVENETKPAKSIIDLSFTDLLENKVPNVPNKNTNNVLVDLSNDSNFTLRETIGEFVLSEEDSSLVAALGELYSSGYRVVHDPASNMTLSIGSEYTKLTIDGQDLNDRWVFINALEVLPDSMSDKETLPLNFMFLESTVVKTFLESGICEWDVLVVPAEDFPLFSMGPDPSVIIPEVRIDSVLNSLLSHLQNLKSLTGIADGPEAMYHNHSDDDCCHANVSAEDAAATSSGNVTSTLNDFQGVTGRPIRGSNKQKTKPLEDNSANQKKTSGDTKKQQAIEARWKIAIAEYRKLTGNIYERQKGDRIDVFERLILKIRDEIEQNERRDREKKEKEKLQKEKDKKEKEQKAEKERLAKLAKSKLNSVTTSNTDAAATPQIDLTNTSRTAAANSTPANRSHHNDIDAPVTKADIERVDSYRKMFHKSILDTMMEEQQKRDLQTYFVQNVQSGTRKLILPTSDTSLALEYSSTPAVPTVVAEDAAIKRPQNLGARRSQQDDFRYEARDEFHSSTDGRYNYREDYNYHENRRSSAHYSGSSQDLGGYYPPRARAGEEFGNFYNRPPQPPRYQRDERSDYPDNRRGQQDFSYYEDNYHTSQREYWESRYGQNRFASNAYRHEQVYERKQTEEYHRYREQQFESERKQTEEYHRYREQQFERDNQRHRDQQRPPASASKAMDNESFFDYENTKCD